MLDERVNRCPVLADGLGTQTPLLAVREILLGGKRQQVPAADR